MLMARGTEWWPTFGASWQVVQLPVKDAGTPGLSFRPPTPEMVIGRVLNRVSPRATDRRAAVRAVDSSLPATGLSQRENSVKATGSNAAPVGFPPSGSLIPTKKA